MHNTVQEVGNVFTVNNPSWDWERFYLSFSVLKGKRAQIKPSGAPMKQVYIYEFDVALTEKN